MEIIDRQGPDAAIAYLAAFDYGEETVSAAMENGYVYETAPQTPADRLVKDGDYALTYSPDLNYVGLSRRIDAPEPERESTTAEAALPGGVWGGIAGRGVRMGRRGFCRMRSRRSPRRGDCRCDPAAGG